MQEETFKEIIKLGAGAVKKKKGKGKKKKVGDLIITTPFLSIDWLRLCVFPIKRN